MTPLQQAQVLRRAAALIDRGGLRRNGWGRPGAALCLNTALAAALGLDSRRLGRFGFYSFGSNDVTEAVGTLIRDSGLLDHLPVPQTSSWQTRRVRPQALSAGRAVQELARWNDVPGRGADLAVEVLRAQAGRLEKRGFDLFLETALVAAPWLDRRAAAQARPSTQARVVASSAP